MKNVFIILGILVAVNAAADGEIGDFRCFQSGEETFSIKYTGGRFIDQVHVRASDGALVMPFLKDDEQNLKFSRSNLDLMMTFGTCAYGPGSDVLVTCSSGEGEWRHWATATYDFTYSAADEVVTKSRNFRSNDFQLKVVKESVTTPNQQEPITVARLVLDITTEISGKKIDSHQERRLGELNQCVFRNFDNVK